MTKLVAFDGDDTLWEPLSVVNLSDRTPTDAQGNPDFGYSRAGANPLLVRRDDGALFALRPEAEHVLAELRGRGVLAGVISYNHEGNVRRILEAFDILDLFDYVVAEWHSNKDQMLGKMLAQARDDGHDIGPQDLLLVDDDPWLIYRGQCERMGAGFRCFGSDLSDLGEVLAIVGAEAPA